MRRRVFASLLAAVIGSVGSASLTGAYAAPATPPEAVKAGGDPYLWLEDVNGPRAMAWVDQENKRSLAVLESDPRYATLHAEALALAQAKDRIPSPRFLNGDVYNFWQDADHVRGLWRRTSVEDYANPAPDWTAVLDLDQLAKAEHANWVYKGAICALPQERRCLIALSDGGEDATTLREFDLETDRFIDGGFTLGHSKQSADWLDSDTILVARDWGPGSMTASGYPYVVKVLHRDQTLSQAEMVFHGEPSDVSVDPNVLVDGQGHRAALIVRSLSAFEFETYLLGDHGADLLSLPKKSSVDALVAGRLIVSLKQDWTPAAGGKTFAQGSVVAIDLAAARAEPDRLSPTLVWAPGPREGLDDVAAVKDRLVLTALDNVRGRAYVLTPPVEAGPDADWIKTRIDLPDNSAIGLVSASRQDDRSYLSVSSFLAPNSLWLDDAWRGSLTQVKTLPPKFDSSNLVTEQLEATSKDGTKVPYFVVHRKDIKYDGSNPTLLYAYGGFEISMTPNYSATIGKLWLERGGVYVLANIRGGGEFGPAWHDAGLNVHRQRIYDDFAAVAEDLIARRITSPRRLGIRGGSNGGLLMGVEFEQHPELWSAVIIDVPLLDMLRYEQIAAGASWVGEYGSVSVPAQRIFLASISPYNNLKAGVTYPEPFIFTTTKDDRVGPVHARKFAAKMEAMGLPFLYYENTEGGHAAGANLQESAREQALEMTYLTRKLMD